MGNCGRSEIHYFKYNEIGHYARECTKDMLREQSVQGSNAPRNGRAGRPPNPVRSIIVRSEVELYKLKRGMLDKQM